MKDRRCGGWRKVRILEPALRMALGAVILMGSARTLPAQPQVECSPDMMMATIADDFEEYDEDVQLFSGMSADINPLDDAQTYDKAYSLFIGLRPGLSDLQLRGLVHDGGTACTDPVGDNFMLEVDLGTMSQSEQHQNYGDAFGRMTQQEQMDMSTQMRRAVDIMAGDVVDQALTGRRGFNMPMLPARVTRDAANSAMFEVYSPNGVSWIFGSLLKPSETQIIYEGKEHGWLPNSAAHIWIVLPYNSVNSLEVGGQYHAIVPSLGEGSPFYVRTDGVWTHRDPRLYECEFVSGTHKATGPAGDLKSTVRDAFAGTIYSAYPAETSGLGGSGLGGTLSVESIANGYIIGSFDLFGEATLEVSTYEYYYSDNQMDACPYGGPGKLVGAKRTSTTQSDGRITITGGFIAPASVEVERPGRRIGYTRKAGG